MKARTIAMLFLALCLLPGCSDKGSATGNTEAGAVAFVKEIAPEVTGEGHVIEVFQIRNDVWQVTITWTEPAASESLNFEVGYRNGKWVVVSGPEFMER